LAYGGVFFLGFGGSRWTSDIALNFYKTVLSVAAQLMAMLLLIGIGKTFVSDYYDNMSGGANLKELGIMLVASIMLFYLTNKIPPLIGSIIEAEILIPAAAVLVVVQPSVQGQVLPWGLPVWPPRQQQRVAPSPWRAFPM